MLPSLLNDIYLTKTKACYFVVAIAGRMTELYKCECLVSTTARRYKTHYCNMICRSAPIHGFHDDYAFVVKGLLDLYEANFDPHWIELAEKLQDIQDRLFWDTQNGGYFSTIDDSQMILRMKDGTFDDI